MVGLSKITAYSQCWGLSSDLVLDLLFIGTRVGVGLRLVLSLYLGLDSGLGLELELWLRLGVQIWVGLGTK